jgi:anti-sigma factor RsiW
MISSEETCAAVEDAFGALLSGEATREEIRRANRHLEVCARCRAEFADLAGFRRRYRAAYGITAAPSRRRFASIAGLALAASLVIGLAVSRLPGDWHGIVETPGTPGVAIASVETAIDDDEIWIEILSDEEIEDLMIAALEP